MARRLRKLTAMAGGFVLVMTPLATPATADGGPSLRKLAERADVAFGSAAQSFHLRDRPYERLLRRHAGVITFENEAKWGVIHPARGRYDFAGADRLARWAWRHGMSMRGHTLVWHVQNPDWLRELEPTREEAVRILRRHIKRVAGHYKRRFPGLIVEWDVVNEAIDNDGTRRQNLWQRWIGDRYIEIAFRTARRAAGRRVDLYLNDYFDNAMMAGAEAIGGEFDDGDPFPMTTPGASGTLDCDAVVKCARTRDLVTALRARDVPVDGVGFQGHMASPTPSDYRGLTAWVGDLGLDWAITEADRPIPAGANQASREAQATAFATALASCLDDPACNTYVVWGLADRYTWWKQLSGGALPDALPFGEALAPKLAFAALAAELAGVTPAPRCGIPRARLRVPTRFGPVRRARAIVVGTGRSRVARSGDDWVGVSLRGVRGPRAEVRLTLHLGGERPRTVRVARRIDCSDEPPL